MGHGESIMLPYILPQGKATLVIGKFTDFLIKCIIWSALPKLRFSQKMRPQAADENVMV